MNQTQAQAYNLNLGFTNLGGNSVLFSSYQGKWLFVEWFWTQCHFCIQQHPDLEKLNNAITGNFTMVSLAGSRDTLTTIKDFKAQHITSWVMGLDKSDAFAKKFGITGTPTMILFDPNGYLVKSWNGLTDFNTLYNYISPLVQGKVSYTTLTNNYVGNPGTPPSVLGALFSNPIIQAGIGGSILVGLYLFINRKPNSESIPQPEKKGKEKSLKPKI